MSTAAKLPAVLAYIGMTDCGPCDGEMSGTCPHCGAGGRYIFTFLCDDGTKRSAMRGCAQLFPGSGSRSAKLVQEAFSRKAAAIEAKKKLASWWADILQEVDAFHAAWPASQTEFALFSQRVQEIDARRQSWLKQNGYGRGGRRS